MVDALLVSSIYVLRAFSGYILIGVPPALPNVLPIAFVALYLIFVKKRSTILILGQDAAIEQRETFRWYNLVRCRWGAVVFGSLAYFYYALWVFVTRKFPLLVGISTLFPAGLLLVAFTRYTETVPPAGIFIWRALKDWKVSTCVAILALLYMVQILIPN